MEAFRRKKMKWKRANGKTKNKTKKKTNWKRVNATMKMGACKRKSENGSVQSKFAGPTAHRRVGSREYNPRSFCWFVGTHRLKIARLARQS